jgi:large subunit ribosomal protein L25
MPIQINAREAARVLRRVRGSELIELEVDGTPHNVLAQDMQRNALRGGEFVHIDFYAVDMSRKLQTRIPIRLVGTSYAVQSLSGVLVRGITEIGVEALPGDLVAAIDVDLGELKEIGSAIFVRDVYIPPALTVLTNPDELVARVTAAATEEAVAPAGEGVAEPEVIEKGKADEEEEGE